PPPAGANDGLTPTPALALDARPALSSAPVLLAHNRRRPPPSIRLIATLALVGAAALGVLIAVLVRDPAPPRSQPPDPTTTAGKAAALLDRGKPSEAIKV